MGVFASTPSRDYRLADMQQFLQDVHHCALKNPAAHCRKSGPALYPGVQELAKAMKAPTVPTHLIYSDGSDTISQLKYDSDDLLGKPDVSMNEPGDGTIVAASIEAVGKAWEAAGTVVTYHKAPGAISHKDLISCDFTVKLVEQLVSSRSAVDTRLYIRPDTPRDNLV